jgi:hypothetical protein
MLRKVFGKGKKVAGEPRATNLAHADGTTPIICIVGAGYTQLMLSTGGKGKVS